MTDEQKQKQKEYRKNYKIKLMNKSKNIEKLKKNIEKT